MRIKIMALLCAPLLTGVAAGAAPIHIATHQSSRISPGPNPGYDSSTAPRSSEVKWLTDFAAARRLAKSENKPMLLDFTGSDWCGWCMKLDREVFATREFQDYAAKNLVLVKVDFPRRRVLLPAERAQNERLAGRFGVEGFPTLVVLDANGRQLGTLGYMPGGPEPLLAKLQELTHGRNRAS